MKSFSHVQLFVTPWTVACQAPPSMGFPRQEISYTAFGLFGSDYSQFTLKAIISLLSEMKKAKKTKNKTKKSVCIYEQP